MAKARISALAAELKNAEPAPGKAGRKAPPKDHPVEANPERGQRGDFLKTTITIPADMLLALRYLGLKRRAAGQKDTGVSELIREAVAGLLERK